MIKRSDIVLHGFKKGDRVILDLQKFKYGGTKFSNSIGTVVGGKKYVRVLWDNTENIHQYAPSFIKKLTSELPPTILNQVIHKGDVVFHNLSKLHFRCENNKMERWMNMNPYYVKSVLPEGYLL